MLRKEEKGTIAQWTKVNDRKNKKRREEKPWAKNSDVGEECEDCGICLPRTGFCC